MDEMEARIWLVAGCANPKGRIRELAELVCAKDTEIERLRGELRLIADQDDTELMLDPTWAKRIAMATLKQTSVSAPERKEP